MKEKSYQAVYEQYMRMAQSILKGGREVLEAFHEDGDYSLFVINRGILDEADLNEKHKKILLEYDQKISELFTPELLKAYDILDAKVYKWWERKMTEREHLARLIGIVESSVKKSEERCIATLEYILMSLNVNLFDQNENKDLWEDLKIALKKHPVLKKENNNRIERQYPMGAKEDYWWQDPENWE